MLLERIIETVEKFLNDFLHEQKRSNEEILHETKRGHRQTMAAIDDLKTAFSGLATSVSAELNAISTKLSTIPVGGTSDADIAGVVTQINDLKAVVDNETAVLTAPAPTA